MPKKRTTDLAIQVAACHICHHGIDRGDDCWRSAATDGALIHVGCLAVLFSIEDSPSRLDHEVADDVNDAGDDLCFAFCHNRAHNPMPCDFGGRMLTTPNAIGCSAPPETEWWFDHFHAIKEDDTPCGCRHRSWQEALALHAEG